METIFTSFPPESHLHWNIQHPHSFHLWLQIKQNDKRYYCLFSLKSSFPSPLVLTIAAFEISFFQVPERQYPSIEIVQVRRIFQRLHPQTSPLNYSLALVVLLRSLLSQKNSTPFSNVHFTPYIMYSFGMFIFFGCFQYLFGNNKPVRLQQYSKYSFKNEIYFFSFCSIVPL